MGQRPPIRVPWKPSIDDPPMPSNEVIGSGIITGTTGGSANVTLHTGPLSPDVTGVYNLDGVVNGHMSYKRQDGGYYIYTIGGLAYTIGVNKIGSSLFLKGNDLLNPAGIYGPVGPNTGLVNIALT